MFETLRLRRYIISCIRTQNDSIIVYQLIFLQKDDMSHRQGAACQHTYNSHWTGGERLPLGAKSLLKNLLVSTHKTRLYSLSAAGYGLSALFTPPYQIKRRPCFSTQLTILSALLSTMLHGSHLPSVNFIQILFESSQISSKTQNEA